MMVALKAARGKVTRLAQYYPGRPANGIENAWLVTDIYWISKA
ncbi:hypothetical protein [Mesorhizobium sp. B2-3-13]|nr:hypothetical protein [Mesorhizobium sp. B2-3-13]